MVNWAAVAADLLTDHESVAVDERRAFERSGVVAGTRAAVVVNRAGQRVESQVTDLSVTGLGMQSHVAIREGRYVIVEMVLKGKPRRILARVAYCRGVEGGFRLGAEFFDEVPEDQWEARLSE